MRIAVTGGNALVGSSIKAIAHQYPEHEFVFLKRSDCELASRMAVMTFFSGGHNRFDCIIHLAAKVGGLFMNLESNVEMFSENIKINENIRNVSFSNKKAIKNFIYKRKLNSKLKILKYYFLRYINPRNYLNFFKKKLNN